MSGGVSDEYVRRVRRLVEELGLDVPVALIVAEEFARELADRVGEEMREAVKVKRPVSRILDRKNWTINTPTELVVSNVRGRLRELSLEVNTPSFDVLIQTDNVPRVYKPYSELLEISSYLESIDAIEVDGKYLLRIGELNWLTNCTIAVYPSNTVTLTRVFGVWDEYV